MEKETKLVSIGMYEKLSIKKPRQTNSPVCCSFQVKICPRSQQAAHLSIIIHSQMGKGTKISFSWYVRKIIDKKAQANKCPSFLQFPGKDLPKVTTDSSLLNNNSLSNGKRYQISFSWYVRKNYWQEKPRQNKCRSFLQFPGKDLPKVTTDSSTAQ